MELMGFKHCLEYLLGYGLSISTFVSDRHLGIAAYMRNVTNITHYFDVWHLKKSKIQYYFHTRYDNDDDSDIR